MMEVEQLYEILRKVQEPKGYFFNKDKEKVFELLAGLLANKERYGYMCCPCRLAANDREHDKDIICPCIYREPDVAEIRKLLLQPVRFTSLERGKNSARICSREKARREVHLLRSAKQAFSYVGQAFHPAVSRVEEQANWKVCPTSVIAFR